MAGKLPYLFAHQALGAVGEAVIVAAVFIPALVVDISLPAGLHRVIPDRLPKAFGECCEEDDGESV